MFYSPSYSLLCLWAAQTVSPFAPDFICLYIPGLNARQVEVCRQVPAAMNILTAAEETFAVECEWQFRKERWNCTGISPPIYHDPDIPGTVCACESPRAVSSGTGYAIAVRIHTSILTLLIYTVCTTLTSDISV